MVSLRKYDKPSTLSLNTVLAERFQSRGRKLESGPVFNSFLSDGLFHPHMILAGRFYFLNRKWSSIAYIAFSYHYSIVPIWRNAVIKAKIASFHLCRFLVRVGRKTLRN